MLARADIPWRTKIEIKVAGRDTSPCGYEWGSRFACRSITHKAGNLVMAFDETSPHSVAWVSSGHGGPPPPGKWPERGLEGGRTLFYELALVTIWHTFWLYFIHWKGVTKSGVHSRGMRPECVVLVCECRNPSGPSSLRKIEMIWFIPHFQAMGMITIGAPYLRTSEVTPQITLPGVYIWTTHSWIFMISEYLTAILRKLQKEGPFQPMTAIYYTFAEPLPPLRQKMSTEWLSRAELGSWALLAWMLSTLDTTSSSSSFIPSPIKWAQWYFKAGLYGLHQYSMSTQWMPLPALSPSPHTVTPLTVPCELSCIALSSF